MGDLSAYETLEFTSSVPSIQRVIAAEGVNPGSLTAPVLHGAAELCRLTTGRTWLAHANRTGVAAVGGARRAQFDSFTSALENLPAISSAWAKTATSLAEGIDDPAQLSKAVIDAQVQTISSLYAKAASDVPILNMVVGFMTLGVNVGRVIWAENHTAKDKVGALEVDPWEDTALGRELLDVTRTDDWTDLFLPYHNAAGPTYVQSADVEYGTGYRGGRVWLGTEGGHIAPLGQGLIPGGGVARQWQYRGKQASTGMTGVDRLLRWMRVPIAAAKGFERYTTYGFEYYRPCTEQIGQALWSQVTTPGPAMFKVDAAEARDAWDAYWRQWIYGFNLAATQGNELGARVLLTIISAGTMDSFPDWPKLSYGSNVYNQVPAEYRDELAYKMVKTGETIILGGGRPPVEEVLPELADHILGNWWVTRRGITLRYLDNLRDLQAAALKTIEVAYLVGDEPGLSAGFRQEWEDNRRALLEHPSLQDVDFSRVPDSPWKTEAASRKIKVIKAAP